MNELKALKNRAEQKIKAADHLLAVTYPILKEPKLLILVIENIFYALDSEISISLMHENIFKKEYEENFDEKFSMFKRKIATKYDLNKELISFIEKIRKIIEEHKKTAVEFTRKEKLIITNENYSLIKITPDECKKLISEAKKHIKKINQTME